MSHSSSSRGGGWLWLALAAVLLIAGSIALPIVARSRKVSVMIGADGQAHLFGIPLGKGVFRRIIFSALFRATDAEVGLGVPPAANITNVIEISQAMTKAGWTNRHPRPNQYE